MNQKKYWQNFGERNQSEAFQQNANDEFKEELPFEGMDAALDAATPRRDFLKYIGFSTAAAAIAAGCEVPAKKIIPYLNRPQDVIPGAADYYATTYMAGGDAISIVAKVRDGRPIKIEGNELSTITKGGTSARVQASVLDLYDTARLRHPLADKKEVSSFEALDNMVNSALVGLGSSTLVLLTTTITSTSTKQIIADFLLKYPGSKHVQYDGISYSGLLSANEACYGIKSIPSYHFDKAKVVVSLGADFLGTWLSPIEFAKAYATSRRVTEKNPVMSKHYQFESMMSMTGANADERYTHKPSETNAVALALLNAINGQAITGVPNNVKKGIEKAAKDLMANRGSGLVVSGSNHTQLQIVINAINEAIGANGSVINWGAPNKTRQGIDADMSTLLADMEAGRVGALLVYDANPAYNYFDADRFKKAATKVKTTISFSDKMDETADLCKFVIPSHHYLESWGDAEPKAGYYTLMQPTINPLFKTRHWQDNLLKWSASPFNYAQYFKNFWTTQLTTNEGYTNALMKGVIEPAAMPLAAATYSNEKLGEATIALSSTRKGGKYELVLYQKVSLGDGSQGNNPWLLETPDPITKATWDNYAMLSPSLAKELLNIDITDRKQADTFEVNPKKPVVSIKAGKTTLKLPALIIPGMEGNTIAIAVGFGRSEKVGRATKGAGQNAYALANSTNFIITDISIAATEETYPLAQNQTHSSYEGRHEVVKELTLASFKKDPNQVYKERDEELKPFGGIEKFEKEGTIYPHFERPGLKWGMNIDLNSCFGCGACVVACNAENNVAVVGKSEVMRFHDMQWLRIDRYFSGDPLQPDSIQTVFQPMLCQHCDNAPCENVCPVAATNHSSEGINQMTYNRCIGTRYCANNCPYKVRRFNWADYTGADSFANNQKEIGVVGQLDDSVLMMNDDLTRMVLNPDVTVRSRGVIEKCSFCVQRTQDGKLKAKKENRVLVDADVKAACQQACPADAIVFGNVNNKESAIANARKDNKARLFHSLEQLHVLPNVSYLAKVRNTEHLSAHEEKEANAKA
jgi:MoCo/4Fe-4S cofactor protein with predicted Tat translocation signal